MAEAEVRKALESLAARRRVHVPAELFEQSPCKTGEPDQWGLYDWKPVPLAQGVDFSGLEALLGAPVHPDAKAFYSTWLLGWIQSVHSEMATTLMTHLDAGSIARHLIGLCDHLEFQKTSGLRYTIPVANTDGTDRWFSVVNGTGEVVLQEIGGDDHVVAPSLADFLAQLL